MNWNGTIRWLAFNLGNGKIKLREDGDTITFGDWIDDASAIETGGTYNRYRADIVQILNWRKTKRDTLSGIRERILSQCGEVSPEIRAFDLFLSELKKEILERHEKARFAAEQQKRDSIRRQRENALAKARNEFNACCNVEREKLENKLSDKWKAMENQTLETFHKEHGES